MGDDLVQRRVVRDLAQISVMLDPNQRVTLERLHAKPFAAPKPLGIEHRVISFEELLNDVEHRALARSAFAVEHNEFLDLLAVPGNDGTDGPFKLPSLLLGI